MTLKLIDKRAANRDDDLAGPADAQESPVMLNCTAHGRDTLVRYPATLRGGCPACLLDAAVRGAATAIHKAAKLNTFLQAIIKEHAPDFYNPNLSVSGGAPLPPEGGRG